MVLIFLPLFTFLGTTASIIGYINSLPKYQADFLGAVLEFLYQLFWSGYTIIWVCSLLLAIATFVFLNQLLNRSGVTGTLNFFVGIRRFYIPLYGGLIESIHSCEHLWIEARQKIEDKKITNPQNPEFKSLVKSYIKEVRRTISYLNGADMSIHIKLFFEKSGTEKLKKNHNFRNVVLRPYVREPSKQERKKIIRKKLDWRDDTEAYVIVTGKSGKSQNLQKRNRGKNSQSRVNSAYNSVFSNTAHYSVLNDVSEEKKNKNYYSTGNNSKSFYNSLAVFVIAPQAVAGQPMPENSVYGLLILDSFKKGIFEIDLSCQIIGYFAHRLYELFRTLDSNN